MWRPAVAGGTGVWRPAVAGGTGSMETRCGRWHWRKQVGEAPAVTKWKHWKVFYSLCRKLESCENVTEMFLAKTLSNV